MKQFTLLNTKTSAPVWIKKTILFGLILSVLIGMTGCSQSVAQQVQSTVEATATTIPTATQMPSPTPTLTQAPTATPQPTVTPVPPTATPVPPLAVLEGGFNAWCAPLEYAGTKAQGPDALDNARLLVQDGDVMRVQIPAVYCVMVYSFNQPVPAGLELGFFDGANLFYKLPLVAADGKPDVAWTEGRHEYVINPPLWEVEYRLAVINSDGKELWSHQVKFAKPVPEECLFGGLPDPVTLYCAITDPGEIEPHADATYPYDRSRLTPDAGE